MTTWAEFEAAAPALAARGRELLHRGDADEALLATVRDDEPPRIHPINVAIVDGHLYAFILASAKRTDLERDGRYALHTHQDPAAPSEFAVRGRASLVTSAAAAVGRRGRVVVRGRRHVHALRVLDRVGAAGRAPDGGRLAAPVHEVERRLTAARSRSKRSDFDTGLLTVSSGTVAIVGSPG